MKVVFLGIFLIFMSCNGQKKVTSNNEDMSNELTLLIKDSYSGVSTPEIQIIKEPTSLKGFFSKINKTRKPGLAVPKIDFTKEMIILLCSGEQKGEAVTKLVMGKESVSNIIIEVKEEGNPNSTAITSPFYLYKMPLTDKEIVFEKL